MASTIYLLRHAAVSPSPAYAPDFDWPLNDRGRQQAEQLVAALTALGIAAAYTSPQRRALETVRPFAAAARLQLDPVEELRESRCNRAWVDDFEAMAARYWDDFDYRMDGCESHAEAQARFVGAICELAVRHAGEAIVCSSGGQVIALALHRADPSVGYRDWARIRKPDLLRLDWAEGELTWDREFVLDLPDVDCPAGGGA
jgi:2,3-bisphosphoglycerate-dependent phosphoglycerate mutase